MSHLWFSFYLRQFITAYLLREMWARCFEVIHRVHPYYAEFFHSKAIVLSAMKGTVQHKRLIEWWRCKIVGGSNPLAYLQTEIDFKPSK